MPYIILFLSRFQRHDPGRRRPPPQGPRVQLQHLPEHAAGQAGASQDGGGRAGALRRVPRRGHTGVLLRQELAQLQLDTGEMTDNPTTLIAYFLVLFKAYDKCEEKPGANKSFINILRHF